MRTTLDLPDELLKKAKVAAIERGTTLREVVSIALSRELGVASAPNSSARTTFPLFRSKGKGKLRIDEKVISRIEDEDFGRRGGFSR
jgi:hypothetical protein